ncbi:hypothetical protein Ancab_004550, partial [Ancistrocladus abbreviatus]
MEEIEEHPRKRSEVDEQPWDDIHEELDPMVDEIAEVLAGAMTSIAKVGTSTAEVGPSRKPRPSLHPKMLGRVDYQHTYFMGHFQDVQQHLAKKDVQYYELRHMWDAQCNLGNLYHLLLV